MAVSPLAKESYPADPSNYSGPSYRAPISEITVHHMAGVLSAERCGEIFQNPGRNGSSHYGIGLNGEIAWYVDESCVAWTNSNWGSNCRAVTIENSDSQMGGNWPVSDATFDSLVKLVADIAKRNNIGYLTPGENLTWHSMYANTNCPGDYLRGRMQDIADGANKINGYTPEPTPTPPEPTPSKFNVGDKVVPKTYVDYYGTPLRKTRDYYFISSIAGNRAVLSADNVQGPIYAAMNTDNLELYEPAPAPTPTPTPEPGIKVGDKVTLNKWVDYTGTPLKKTRDYYFVSQITGDRAVLNADSVSGPIYAAVNVNNLTKVGGGTPTPAPAPAPTPSIAIGDKVTLKQWVDYNGTPLKKTRDYYFVNQLANDRAVLTADSMNGPVYAAVNKNNLIKV